MFYQHQDSDIANTHFMSLSWIMGDERMQYIYWLLMNFPNNFLTSCTSIEQVKLPYNHTGKIYYINTRIVTFVTHILCESYWIMGDRQMEYIYWLLINFPDNLLKSCTSFEKVNLCYRKIWKIYNINSGIVTLLTHILCDSYWIMGDRRMNYIYWLLVNFPYNLVTISTSIEQFNLPPSHLGKIYYINTGIVTLLTQILCVSLESWVMDRFNTYIDFLWTFLFISSRVALLLSRWTYLTVTLKKNIISTLG
jgi:hypothetical protein